MIRLKPMGMQRAPLRVARWSSGGAAADVVLKPDVVATGSGVLGVVPPGDDGLTWDLASGTSAAAAVTSGAAALVVSAHPDWSAAAVRSALATTAHRLSGTPVLRSGAGRVTPGAGVRPGLVYDVAPDAYRAWLEGDRTDLNTPWVLLRGTADTAERTVTNATGRRLYFSSSARGFAHHQVQVTPAAVRLGPGESATFTVTVERMPTAQPVDDGWVTWRGATGTLTRIPVVIAR
jgi:subtilisin family serine protease